MTQPDSNPCTKLTAITGTWSDLERHARYVYENADEQSSEWMLSEAVLVLLNLDRESRRPDSNQRTRLIALRYCILVLGAFLVTVALDQAFGVDFGWWGVMFWAGVGLIISFVETALRPL